MLWIYINNQGVAECVVNVGNRIRQGDKIPLFICLQGMDEQAAIYELNHVAYLKPGAKEFVTIPFSSTISTREFLLGNPSEANSHFIAYHSYDGYDVDVPADATSFDGNGGHVAFEIVLFNKSTGDYVHAQTVSTFVEATYGKHGTNITSQDYSTLIDMLRLSNFNYSVNLECNVENGVSRYGDDSTKYPILIVGEAMGFARGVVSIDVSKLNDSAGSTSEDEDSDGYANIVYTNVAGLELPVGAQFVGRDQNGNDIRMRINGMGSGSVNVDANIADLRSVGENTVILSFFGTCAVHSLILDFTSESGEGIVQITGTAAYSEQVAWDYEGDLVTSEIVPDSIDPSKGVLTFHFKIPQGRKAGYKDPSVSLIVNTLQPHESASGNLEVTQTGPDEDNDYTTDFAFTLNIPKGADGVITNVGGAIGFEINPTSGQLLVISSDGGNHGLHLVNDDPNSADYYETLGLDASYVGHIVLMQ